MIDSSFLKSHFVGRDGFIWWIGQVAPKETWKGNLGTGGELADGTSKAGYGERYRVRIMGYHTANKELIPDDELPFATVMYPVTAGSGDAGASHTSNITQGTFVFGFFLDGEDAQQPVIMGCIGYNEYQEVMEKVPAIGFKPFYGLDKKKPGGGETKESQSQTLVQVTAEQGATDTSQGQTTNEDQVTGPAAHKHTLTTSNADEAESPEAVVEKAIPSANPQDLPIKNIQKALQRAIQTIEKAKRSVRELGEEQKDRIEDLQNLINAKIDEATNFVAAAIKYVYQLVEEQVFNKMDLMFKQVFSAAKPSESEKVKTTQSQVMDKMACFFRKLFGGLIGMVRNFIADAVTKIVNVPTCFVEKFVGNVMGTISGTINGAMDAVKGIIDSAVDMAEGGLDIAGDAIGLVSKVLSLLNCDDFPDESPVSEWSYLYGSGTQFGKGDIANILNKAKEYAASAQEAASFDGVLDTFSFDGNSQFNSLLDAKSQLDDCVTDEFPCGPPQLNIFGSTVGAGAEGNIIINAAGEVIGVDMKSFGVGYDDQTRANVKDDCGRGRGAVIKPIFGDVNNHLPFRRIKKGKNKGTPASAPESIGFGPFNPQVYEFNESDDYTVKVPGFNPENRAYGTPSFGLGPSFAKLGKKTPKEQLSIRDLTGLPKFTTEVFSIPEADPEAQKPPNIKFVLKNRTDVENVEVDFDFSSDDISASGSQKYKQKQGVVVIDRTKKEGGNFVLGPKKNIKDDEGKLISFRESFDGGHRQRVIKDREYIVEGFQYDGEGLINPLKITNNGKCVVLDDVYNRKTFLVEKQNTVKDAAQELLIKWDLGNPREQGLLDSDPTTFWQERLEKNNKSVRLRDGHGDDRNATYRITSGDAVFKIGADGQLYISGKGKVRLQLKYDDDPAYDKSIPDGIAVDRITIKDDFQTSIWQQTKKGTKKPNNGKPNRNVEEEGEDNEGIELVPQTRIESYWVEKTTLGEANKDYDDLVICVKRGKFKKKQRKGKRDLIVYVLKDEVSDPDVTPPEPGSIPIGTIVPPPGRPDDEPRAPVLPSFPSGGGAGGGIPGILSPGPGKNSTFHPFPGTTTLGAGKWVPGPIPPGGGGPHVGPAVFIHNEELIGELIGKQGKKMPKLGPKGGFAPNSGGAGGGTPDPGSIPPGGIGPGGPGGGPGGIGPGGPGGGPGGVGPGGPGGVGPGGPGGPGGVGPGGPGGPGGIGPGGPGGPGGIGPGGPGGLPSGGIQPGGEPGGLPDAPGDPGGVDPGDVGPQYPGDPGAPGDPSPGGISPFPGPVPPGPGTFYPNDNPKTPTIDGIPVFPGTMVPPDFGGIPGPGIGVIDVVVLDPGSGYLPGPDGSTGGDGRTYSFPNDTRIVYNDGIKDVVGPGQRLCLDAGDTIILPVGTQVITEPFDGEGGGELIVGGRPHVLQKPGCITTPDGGGAQRPLTYPVLMYLCDVIITSPGYGYKVTDKVVITPSNGAEAELVVDKFGRITDVVITKGGEGFQVIPEITIDSETGKNAELLGKLCIDSVSDITLVDQEKVVQVIDCVGKF